MARQKTKEGVRRTKKEPGWHVVPGVKKASSKDRRQKDRIETSFWADWESLFGTPKSC